MPKLSASQRLTIMSAALAYGEDQAAIGAGPVGLDELATAVNERIEIGVDVGAEDVRESLDPLVWVEVSVPGGIVDLLDAVRFDDDRDVLMVEEGWWRRLAALTPPEAARLYTKAAAAASLDTVSNRYLRSAMAKLRRMVAQVTVVEGDAPPNVAKLRSARNTGGQVLVNIEGRALTVGSANSAFSVIAVFRSASEWMVTLKSVSENADLGLSDGDVMTIPVERILGVLEAETRASTNTDTMPSIVDPEPSMAVTVEYPKRRDWVLDPYAAEQVSNIDDSRRRATVRVWGTGELKTLMLRLGPEGRIISPESLADVRTSMAVEILSLYSDQPR